MPNCVLWVPNADGCAFPNGVLPNADVEFPKQNEEVLEALPNAAGEVEPKNAGELVAEPNAGVLDWPKLGELVAPNAVLEPKALLLPKGLDWFEFDPDAPVVVCCPNMEPNEGAELPKAVVPECCPKTPVDAPKVELVDVCGFVFPNGLDFKLPKGYDAEEPDPPALEGFPNIPVDVPNVEHAVCKPKAVLLPNGFDWFEFDPNAPIVDCCPNI